MKDTLQTTLRQLRLSGPGADLGRAVARSGRPQLIHAEFLELILQDELLVRSERLISAG